DATPPRIPPLSLHDALPIFDHIGAMDEELSQAASHLQQSAQTYVSIASGKLDDQSRIHPFQNLVSLFTSALGAAIVDPAAAIVRSEEHTSELQSRGHLVCRL